MHAHALNDLPDASFRALFRGWLSDTYPAEWRGNLALRLRGPEEKRWLSLLHRDGWRAPSWPVEHGGLGLSVRKQLIYHAELERHGAARFIDFGGTLLGPTLIRYGTAQQQQRYLPPILRGEVLWCQGYSEPGAGSDLAGLSLQARRDGDAFVLNGSKIWTTHANDAQYMFLLARTGTGQRRQEGITFLLMDMRSPGVTVRPIVNLAGDDEFAQVFFDDVRVPVDNVVHEVGLGWEVARALLGVERITNGSPHLARMALDLVDRVAKAAGEAGPGGDFASVRARLACELHDAQALHADVCEAVIRGDASAHMFSILKVTASELFQRSAELLLRVAGDGAGAVEPIWTGAERVDVHRVYMMARPTSIFSGTNEVQRDLIARAVLDTP